MYDTNCPKCNGKMVSEGTGQTLVGYFSPLGHDHDDNCKKRHYVCLECGNSIVVSKQNKCPTCDWAGKETCFCHEGRKLNEWPMPYNKLVHGMVKNSRL